MATTTTTERRMTKKEERAAERQEAIAYLRRFAPPGSTIYGIVRSVSRSGMSRTMDLYVVHEGSLQYLTGWISTVLDRRRTAQGALKVTGCGMDMVFHEVYSAASVVWREGASEAIASAREAGLPVGSSGTNPGYVWRSEVL